MSIAIFLPNWIGDVVMATPAIRAIRQAYPSEPLLGVARPYVSEVLAGTAWLDQLIAATRGLWAGWQLARELRRHRVRLAVLFTNSPRAALVTALAGVRRRVGYAMYGRRWLLTDALEPLRNADGSLRVAPIIDAYNALAKHVGAKPDYRMELATTGPARETGYVVLNPGAKFGAAKHWPAEHFARLARLLIDRGERVLVLCGPGEQGMARRIAELAGPDVRTLADEPLSLDLTKRCVRAAKLLITTDSGPRHFAAAFGVPVITLFGPTHIEWTETYYPRAVHLQRKLPCGPCQQRICPLGHHRCMTELTPDEVFVAAQRFLEQKELRHAG